MTLQDVFTIRITHSYYSTKMPECLELYLEDQCQQLFRRRGLVFVQQNKSTWRILSLAGETQGAPFSDEDHIDLFLKITDTNFLFITDLPGYSPQIRYKLTLAPGQKVVTFGDFQILQNSNNIPLNILLHLVLPCVQGPNRFPPLPGTGNILFHQKIFL